MDDVVVDKRMGKGPHDNESVVDGGGVTRKAEEVIKRTKGKGGPAKERKGERIKERKRGEDVEKGVEGKERMEKGVKGKEKEKALKGKENKKETEGRRKRAEKGGKRKPGAEERKRERTALVFGASGATGICLVRELLLAGWQVVAFGRRKVRFPGVGAEGGGGETDGKGRGDDGPTEAEGLTQVVIDYEELVGCMETGEYATLEALPWWSVACDAHAAFGCLGVPKKKAGGKEGQYRVDHTYTLAAAAMSRHAGVLHFSLISSLGSDSSSSMHYAKMKGETEDDVIALGFSLFSIYRPSFLVAHREVPKPGEGLVHAVLPLVQWAWVGPLRKYRWSVDVVSTSLGTL